MLLGDILNGKESSHLVLVNDSVGRNGRPLMYCFVKSLLQRTDFVHVILYDVPPDQLLGSLDEHFRQRVFCYDGFSDPLGWNCLRNRHSHVTVINKNSNVTQIVKTNLPSHFTSTDTGSLVKVAIVIDSLSNLLLWSSCSSVCTFLHQLYTSPVDSLSTGYQVVQVVCLIHADLHDDQRLNSINFLASSILWITETEVQTKSDKTTSWCKILHKRKTGKVIKKVDGFAISGSDYQLREYEEKDWNTSLSVLHNTPAQEADPTQNLTFNLRLTNHEHQARAKLNLPYIHRDETRSKAAVNSTGEGKVFYQPDEADDFDEDDPDDDLDI